MRDLADELAAPGAVPGALAESRRAPEAAERLFAQLACHSARRKGDLLDPREQRALLEALDGIPWAPTCPHGRPVAVPLELAEIEPETTVEEMAGDLKWLDAAALGAALATSDAVVNI